MPDGLIRTIVDYFFLVLEVILFVQIIVSWIPPLQGTAFARFLYNVTMPMIDPIRKRIPRMSAGIFDVSYIVAFLFVWWALSMLDALIQLALPARW